MNSPAIDHSLSTVAIRYEHDVVLARQRARQIAAALGFVSQDQVRIATAVSEIARNAFRYARGGKVEFGLAAAGAGAAMGMCIADHGPGIPNLQQILDGQYVSRTGMGMGIIGARRLMDDMRIESAPGSGTVVGLFKNLPHGAPPVTQALLASVADQLARQTPEAPFEELQRQNQELLRTLDELQQRQDQLALLNKELEDTNRGVVALYAELDERADFLRRAAELKPQFLATMTHEFRTPVNSI